MARWSPPPALLWGYSKRALAAVAGPPNSGNKLAADGCGVTRVWVEGGYSIQHNVKQQHASRGVAAEKREGERGEEAFHCQFYRSLWICIVERDRHHIHSIITPGRTSSKIITSGQRLTSQTTVRVDRLWYEVWSVVPLIIPHYRLDLRPRTSQCTCLIDLPNGVEYFIEGRRLICGRVVGEDCNVPPMNRKVLDFDLSHLKWL